MEADDAYSSGTDELEFTISHTANEWTEELSIADWAYGETASTLTAAAKYGEVIFTCSDSQDGEYASAVLSAVALPDGSAWVDERQTVETWGVQIFKVLFMTTDMENYQTVCENLFDDWEDITLSKSLEFAKRLFKSKYVYIDARLEGVEATYEAASEIIEDLHTKCQASIYCTNPEYGGSIRKKTLMRCTSISSRR